MSSPRRRALVAVAVLVVLLVGAVSWLALRPGPARADDPGLNFEAAAQHLTTTTTAAPSAPAVAPTTTAKPLPQPQNVPADPNADVPVNQIGTIEIPKIGLVHPIFEGIWLTVINQGPGHWPGTALPGGYGNAVFAGHRVTHTHPFRRINELVPGDEIIVQTGTGTYRYRVTGSEIVKPNETWIVDQTPGYRITLFACHPPGSATERYVVHGELENPPTT
ncbi:MAG: peptidase family protein [Actinomycetia bacterium]|nr:peptidase family protein [Actinomycetes bacterium]